MIRKMARLALITGLLSLSLTTVHHWFGPFAPQPTLKSAVSSAFDNLRHDAADALAGREGHYRNWRHWDLDQWLNVVEKVLAVLALFFALLSLLRREPLRPALAAMVLGAATLGFPYLLKYSIYLVVAALLASLGLLLA